MSERGFFLNNLPVLEFCCYCIPLDTGCYVIGALNILVGVAAAVSYVARLFHPGIVLKLVAVAGIIINVALILVAIYFIIGLVKEEPNSEQFLIMLFIAIILTLVLDLYWFLNNTMKSCPQYSCPKIYFFGVETIVDLLLYGYSLLIVNSFRILEDEGE